MQYDFSGRFALDILVYSGIVFFCGIDVTVTEHLGYHIDVLCFAIKPRAVGGTELMRRYAFERIGGRRIFFDEVFYGAHGDALIL